MRNKCQDGDPNDFLTIMPVFDKDSQVTYKNIFCARCNGATNTSFWKVQFNCGTWFNVTAVNTANILHHNCSVEKTPNPYQLKFSKRCIPRFQDCYNASLRAKNESHCQRECLRYAFPVCIESHKKEIRRFRNLQCALCHGFKPNDLETECKSLGGGVSPPLTIFFDFSSTSKYSITIEERTENEIKMTKQEMSCSLDEVYDPYVGSCKKIVSTVSQNGHQSSKNNESIKTDDEGNKPGLYSNCIFIVFNETDYVRLSNGSIYLKLHNKIYDNRTYIIRGNILLLCVNFSRNLTRTEQGYGDNEIAKTPEYLYFLTSVGCIVSMVSLVLLLVTYILFAELRNLPGKIMINLAFSLLLYQSVFFAAAKHDNQEICLVVAVFLHFFVLSSFTWMNVMAYDVHRIFTSSGKLA